MKKTTKTFAEVIEKRFTPAQLAKIRAAAEADVLELRLRELRELVGKTQTEISKEAEMAQTEISRMERRDDHLLSTLRRYVEGLGGQLEVVAHVGNKRVTLIGV